MAELVASVFARSAEQVHRDARRAAMLGADWVELRLDAWPAAQDLGAVIGGIGLPVLVACRTHEDGGEYRGTLAARRELLSYALRAGAQGGGWWWVRMAGVRTITAVARRPSPSTSNSKH